MRNIKQKVEKLSKEVKIITAKYRIQKINNCMSCKYLRPYNSTCGKNNIRVSKLFGICDYFIEDKDGDTNE